MIRKDVNYEELVGRTITCTYKDARLEKVLVSAIDPEIGFTLANPDDKEDLFWCLTHPEIAVSRKQFEFDSEEERQAMLEHYEKVFSFMTEIILKGEMTQEDNDYDDNQLSGIGTKHYDELPFPASIPQSACAFS